MAFFTCDSESSGLATNSTTLGWTDSLLQAVMAFSFAVGGSTLDLTNSATATSVTSNNTAVDSVSSGAATNALTLKLTANQYLLSEGVASSEANPAPRTDVTNSGTATNAVALSVTATAVNTATATEAWTARKVTTLNLLSGASAESEVAGSSNPDLVTTATATNAVALSVDVRTDLTNTATATSVVSHAKVIVGDLEDDGAATNALTSRTVAGMNLVSSAFSTSAVLFPRPRAAWVMNSESMSMVRYTGVPVSSVARIGNKVLGIGEGGLYEHTGSVDDTTPVTGLLLTGRTAFGTATKKRLSDVRVDNVSSTPMSVRLLGAGHDYTYEMAARAGDAIRTNRVTPGKGMQSVYWQIELIGTAGNTFTISAASIDAAASTTRKV